MTYPGVYRNTQIYPLTYLPETHLTPTAWLHFISW